MEIKNVNGTKRGRMWHLYIGDGTKKNHQFFIKDYKTFFAKNFGAWRSHGSLLLATLRTPFSSWNPFFIYLDKFLSGICGIFV